MQLGVFEIEISLPHTALHVGDRVAHHATKSGLRLGTVHDLLYRRIHQSTVKHGGIVASAAPFGGFGTDRVLHVLDTLAIPLIVERRKMMGRTEPLIVDVLVAALAGVGLHEEPAGNFLSAIDLCRTGKEWPIGAVSLPIHSCGRHRRILDARLILPARFTQITGAYPESSEHQQTNRAANDRCTNSRPQ